MRRLARVLIATLIATALSAVACPVFPAQAAPTDNGVPLLAFYYQWFTPDSWNRAKIDYPQLGRYASDDPRVMRQHIEWAKAAGIDGFIVSWKDGFTNARRLEVLMDVCRQAGFKLAMIYQGLDFNRDPQPVERVAADFRAFRDRYASDPVFYRLGGKPLTIWSGTWAFSHDEVAQVTGPVRDDMLVLSTAKNVADYQRVADVTDGDAYYWSSVNPDTNRNYQNKLWQMSTAIHANKQYWIAPFAPGFDARMVGGSRSVERKDGETMRVEYAAALRSSPDALGLISWNEFSENSYVEPSEKFGARYLDVLRELRRTMVPEPVLARDSSETGPEADLPLPSGLPPTLLPIGIGVAALVGLAVAARMLRRRGG
ncbi:hypothetical protein J5X84_11000 [Streptosporangiaceae bacterium NEAU-GS5]|nr:hypothetical protein [Streptosporangiaceae bacterium NEAU-GS5]